MTVWHQNTAPASKARGGYVSLFQAPFTRLVFACLAVLAGLLLPGSKALGQSQASSATLSGSVTDKTGAVIPGATVTLSSTD